MTLSEELTARGFINQFSGESLEAILDGEKRTFYFGVDPTAPSVHIGNLVGYLFARHLIHAGHTPIMLLGGGTGMIGDPRDTAERPLADSDEVKERTQKLIAQARHLMGSDVMVVNNAEWLLSLNLVEFLRDIGKHFTINQMIKKEIIAKRLTDENPISYTEFAYMLLQAYDFWHLYRAHRCTLQIAGSDQWGNVMSGVELIRKKEGEEVFGVTAPLVVDKATGRKFGKSEGNAVWLDKDMTSPYAFYQFWLNVDDADVVDRLKIFTLLPLKDIDDIYTQHVENPNIRTAQKILAREVTTIVHGEEMARTAERVSDVLFGNTGETTSGRMTLTAEERSMLLGEVPTATIDIGVDIVSALVTASLASSKNEAKQLIASGAIVLNGEKIQDVMKMLQADDFTEGIVILYKGKKHVCVLIRA